MLVLPSPKQNTLTPKAFAKDGDAVSRTDLKRAAAGKRDGFSAVAEIVDLGSPSTSKCSRGLTSARVKSVTYWQPLVAQVCSPPVARSLFGSVRPVLPLLRRDAQRTFQLRDSGLRFEKLVEHNLWRRYSDLVSVGID